MERCKGEIELQAQVRHLVFVATILLFVGGTIFLAGCSSVEVANSQANGPKVSKSKDPLASNAPATDGENAPSANRTPESETNKIRNDRLQERRDRISELAANGNSAMPDLVGRNSRPAPEDSVMSTTLTDKVREMRVFAKHPQLMRVIKIHDLDGGSIKIYLRDGRVFDLPGNRIPQLSTMPSASILQLIGISSTPADPNKLRLHGGSRLPN